MGWLIVEDFTRENLCMFSERFLQGEQLKSKKWFTFTFHVLTIITLWYSDNIRALSFVDICGFHISLQLGRNELGRVSCHFLVIGFKSVSYRIISYPFSLCISRKLFLSCHCQQLISNWIFSKHPQYMSKHCFCKPHTILNT